MLLEPPGFFWLSEGGAAWSDRQGRATPGMTRNGLCWATQTLDFPVGNGLDHVVPMDQQEGHACSQGCGAFILQHLEMGKKTP